MRHHEPITVKVTDAGTNAVTPLTVALSVIGPPMPMPMPLPSNRAHPLSTPARPSRPSGVCVRNLVQEFDVVLLIVLAVRLL